MAEAAPLRPRRIVAVGLKSYLGYAETLDWLSAVAELSRDQRGALDLVLFPVAPALVPAVSLAAESGFRVGAQDVSDRPPGAFTGELPAALLAELGVTYVEIGHAERRYLFSDTPEVVARKTAISVQHGLTPLLCVGEGRLGDTAEVDLEEAVSESVYQLHELLPHLASDLPFVVAYEPVWAIGADEPAPVEHVRAVVDGLRRALEPFPAARVIYGGTAGPGLFDELQDSVDGLFLGRRGHDPAALATVMAELGA